MCSLESYKVGEQKHYEKPYSTEFARNSRDITLKLSHSGASRLFSMVPRDSRTNFHRTFDHHKCLKSKSRHKNGVISNYYLKYLWSTIKFTQMLNKKSLSFWFISFLKVGFYVNMQLSKLKRPRKQDIIKKSTTNLIWPKRPLTLEHRAGKIKRPDFTGFNKVPIVG